MDRKKNFTFKFIIIEAGIWAMYAPIIGYISVFLLAKGISNTEIGLVSALACIASAVLQILISGYADKNKSKSVKSLLIIVSIIQIVLALFLFIIDDSFLLAICLIYGSLIALLQLMVPLANSLAMESLNQGKEINYGVARGISSFFFAVFVALIGIFIKGKDLRVIPVTIIITALVVALSTFSFPFKKIIKNKKDKKENKNSGCFLAKYPKFTLFLLGAVCSYVGHNLINIFLFQITTLKGGNNIDMGVCLSIAAMCEVPVMSGFMYLLKKKDVSFWARFGSIGLTLKILLTLLVPNMLSLYVVQFCQTFGFAIFVVATVYYANKEVEECDRIKGQGYMTMVFTMGTVIASVLGGTLIDLYGITTMLVVGILISIGGNISIFKATLG